MRSNKSNVLLCRLFLLQYHTATMPSPLYPLFRIMMEWGKCRAKANTEKNDWYNFSIHIIMYMSFLYIYINTGNLASLPARCFNTFSCVVVSIFIFDFPVYGHRIITTLYVKRLQLFLFLFVCCCPSHFNGQLPHISRASWLTATNSSIYFITKKGVRHVYKQKTCKKHYKWLHVWLVLMCKSSIIPWVTDEAYLEFEYW